MFGTISRNPSQEPASRLSLSFGLSSSPSFRRFSLYKAFMAIFIPSIIAVKVVAFSETRDVQKKNQLVTVRLTLPSAVVEEQQKQTSLRLVSYKGLKWWKFDKCDLCMPPTSNRCEANSK